MIFVFSSALMTVGTIRTASAVSAKAMAPMTVTMTPMTGAESTPITPYRHSIQPIYKTVLVREPTALDTTNAMVWCFLWSTLKTKCVVTGMKMRGRKERIKGYTMLA